MGKISENPSLKSGRVRSKRSFPLFAMSIRECCCFVHLSRALVCDVLCHQYPNRTRSHVKSS